MKKVNFIFISLIVLISCNPKISVQINKSYPVLDYKKEVMVIGLKQKIPEGSEEIGFVKVEDTGFTMDCSYEIMVDKAKLEARKIGGNAIKITKHLKPSAKSSCHQIEAKILYLENLNNVDKN